MQASAASATASLPAGAATEAADEVVEHSCAPRDSEASGPTLYILTCIYIYILSFGEFKPQAPSTSSQTSTSSDSETDKRLQAGQAVLEAGLLFSRYTLNRLQCDVF